MTGFRRIVSINMVVASLILGLSSSSPALAQLGWGGYGGGWGGYGGYGGYGYNNGAAMAGAAIGGMALGAVVGSAIAQQNQNNYGYGYAQPARRARLCPANQPVYDDWGEFVGYRRVRVAC